MAGGQMRKRSYGGLRELLEILKAHPELAHTLVFDPEKVRRLLRTRDARSLLVGVDVRTLLRSVPETPGLTPLALCLQLTAIVAPPIECPGATKTLPTCPAATKTLPTCPGATKTLTP